MARLASLTTAASGGGVFAEETFMGVVTGKRRKPDEPTFDRGGGSREKS